MLTLGTTRGRIRIPKVLVLHSYDRIPARHIRFSRLHVFSRDNFTCQYCGRHFNRGQLNLDHVQPRSRGGLTQWENVVTSCVKCNFKKANRTPQEAGMDLLCRPARPRWASLGATALGQVPEWIPFLQTVCGSYL